MDTLITLFLKIIRFVSEHLSFTNRRRAGILLSKVLCLLIPKRLAITIDNIQTAYPNQNVDWWEKIARRAFESLAITYLEGLAQRKFTEAITKEQIIFKNPELLTELHSKGKGLLLLSGHYGNWELIAHAANVYSHLKILIVVVEQKYGSTLLDESRTATGNRTIAKNKAARELIKTIQTGGCIALLADQSADRSKDVFVEFFGRPAVTYRAPADIALKFGVPIVMGFADRQDDGKYSVELIELKHDDLTYSEQSVVELTRRHVKILENKIKDHPEMWAWMHRRWKHQPNS